jgi:uncharacterized membrane protein
MGLAILVLGLVVFIGAHGFVTMRGHREKLVAQMGEGPYKGAFSLVSAVGLVLIIYGFGRYRREGLIPVWDPPDFLRHLTDALMWPAFVLLAAAYIPGNIKRALEHPMLTSVKLWAFAHLLANGDLGGIVLFGGILGWAVFDRVSLKRRTDPGGPPIPVGGWRNDAVAVVVGTLVYLAVGLVFHPLLGVPVFVR